MELKKLFRQGFPDEDSKSVVVKQQQTYFHFVLDSGAAKCGGLWGGRKVVWRQDTGGWGYHSHWQLLEDTITCKIGQFW